MPEHPYLQWPVFRRSVVAAFQRSLTAKTHNRFTFGQNATKLLQRLLAERAHRFIFAQRRDDWVPTVRPRTVNAEAAAAETAQWREWNRDQLASELALEEGPEVLRRQLRREL
jgi:hypothetical protein